MSGNWVKISCLTLGALGVTASIRCATDQKDDTAILSAHFGGNADEAEPSDRLIIGRGSDYTMLFGSAAAEITIADKNLGSELSIRFPDVDGHGAIPRMAVVVVPRTTIPCFEVLGFIEWLISDDTQSALSSATNEFAISTGTVWSTPDDRFATGRLNFQRIPESAAARLFPLKEN